MAADYPVTQAVRALRGCGVPFAPHLYDYEERGGTRRSSQALGVPEHQVIKTLVMETDARQPLIVLMHGDYEVSTKQLARVLGVKRVAPCAPERAHKLTGYLVGGTSPFGTKMPLPVYVERSVLALERIYVNGGKRGFLVELAPADLTRALQNVSLVEVSTRSES